jgi:hypothetical protein
VECIDDEKADEILMFLKAIINECEAEEVKEVSDGEE